MNWKANDNNRACKISEYVKQHFIPDYMVCYKTLLRRAQVWIFTENNYGDFESFVKETERTYDEPIYENLRDLYPGYQLPCQGDSGSGNWMKREDMKPMKHVLVGIHSLGASGKCGFGFSMMEKINNVYNMNWIKSHLDLNNP